MSSQDKTYVGKPAEWINTHSREYRRAMKRKQEKEAAKKKPHDHRAVKF